MYDEQGNFLRWDVAPYNADYSPAHELLFQQHHVHSQQFSHLETTPSRFVQKTFPTPSEMLLRSSSSGALAASHNLKDENGPFAENKRAAVQSLRSSVGTGSLPSSPPFGSIVDPLPSSVTRFTPPSPCSSSPLSSSPSSNSSPLSPFPPSLLFTTDVISLSERITSHEKKRNYVECLEDYVLFLHQQLQLIGAVPHKLERAGAQYKGISSRSVRTLLVHMKRQNANLQTKICKQEQEFLSMRDAIAEYQSI